MKISVILAVFNSAKYVATAIESFLQQDYENKELIIFDGKSKDGSHEIIAQYAQENPNLIKWVKEEDDSGISNARNKALRHVSGDVVGFLGADDILHKDFFKEFAYYAKIYPNFDVAYFDYYSIGQEASIFNIASTIHLTKRNLVKKFPVASGEAFYYKKHIFDKFSFNEKNRCSMDYELNVALAASNSRIKFYPIAIPAVFNGCFGDSVSTSLACKQKLETFVIQLHYAKSNYSKLKILWRRKKFILKNFKEFLATKNRLFR